MNAAIFGLILGGAILATPAPSAPLDDSKILGVLDVANVSDIEQGELALSRAHAQSVKAFARTMVKEHTEAKDDERAVAKRLGISITPSPTSNDLKESSNQVVAGLRPMRKNRFDRAYMDSQVNVHKRLLSLIDGQLLPGAQSAEVKSLVSDVRTHVERDIDAAESTLEHLPANAP